MKQKKTFFLYKGVAVLFLLCFFSGGYPLAGTDSLTSDSSLPTTHIPESESSQLLILGTVHLSSYGDEFNSDVLNRLLAVLEDYNPDLIGIEALAPVVIRDMVNCGEPYAKVLEEFGGRTADFGNRVRSALNVSWTKADSRAEELLQEIDKNDDGINLKELRKELVQNFLAVNDIYSALLQWTYIPEAERSGFGSLDQEILDYFAKQSRSSNENISIGLALARKLGHQRMYAINDHRDKEDFIKIAGKMSEALENNPYMKEQPWKAFFNEMMSRQENAYGAGDLLPFYLFLNSPEYVRGDLENQWQVLFKADLPSGMAHTRVAYWDARNFGIAANIRRAMARYPGCKMLVTIGASHKGFLEPLLTESMDVRLIQLKDIPTD